MRNNILHTKAALSSVETKASRSCVTRELAVAFLLLLNDNNTHRVTSRCISGAVKPPRSVACADLFPTKGEASRRLTGALTNQPTNSTKQSSTPSYSKISPPYYYHEISDSHGGEYEDGRLLGCSAVWLYGISLPAFQRCLLPLRPDDGGSKHVWNVGELQPVYTALQPRRRPSLFSTVFTKCRHWPLHLAR
jgi:hypothetical protein